MRISTFWYCMKQGMVNMRRNLRFSLASIATVSACVFLFCLFFSLVVNIQYIVKHVERTVGITVLFDESLPEEQIKEIGERISGWAEIRQIDYISAEEAWEEFKEVYFEGHEELAEGFADDNPLAGSASYQIFLYDISNQDQVVERLKQFTGVRDVNYSNSAVAGFASLNKIIGIISSAIIGVLLVVAVFLINNTISVAAAFRKTENEIMRLIGATNFIIRAPFIVEGLMIGILGALIPLGGTYFLYKKAVIYAVERFRILSGVIQFLPVETIFPYMLAVALTLGVGIGFLGSFFTIRKHLRV